MAKKDVLGRDGTIDPEAYEIDADGCHLCLLRRSATGRPVVKKPGRQISVQT